MINLGYFNDWKILNPINYNWPQNRKRFFEIWFKNEKDFMFYSWPKEEKLTLSIKDILDKVFEDIDKYIWKPLPNNAKERKNKNGYIWGNYIDNRCYKINRYIRTITASFNQPWILSLDNKDIRKLTILETCLLMSFTEDDHNKLLKSNHKLSALKIKKMYGNSIVISLLEKILKNLKF